MNETKTRILGIAAGLLMTMALIAALDSYMTSIQAAAPREVVRMETVTVTANRPAAATDALAATHAGKPASL